MHLHLIDLLTVGITFDNEAEFIAAKRATSFRNPKSFILKKKCHWLKNWDGLDDYLTPKAWTSPEVMYQLPRGLCHRLNSVGYEGIIDPKLLIPFFDMLSSKTLSDSQITACQTFLTNGFCNIEMEVSSGKTMIMANAVSCYLKECSGNRVLVLEPSINLLRQTTKEFRGASDILRGIVGMAGDSKLDIDNKEVVVATSQTINASNSPELRDWLLTVSVVVVDECHHASEAFQKAILACKNATILWGCSGKVEFARSNQKDKQIKIESIYGKPKHVGKAPERHCKLIIKSYSHDSWGGAVDPGLPSAIYTGCEVAFKRSPEDPWKVGTYKGLDENGIPSPVCRSEFNGKMRVDKSKFGIYFRGEQVLDADPLYVVYKTQHDVGLMEFRKRNEWATNLAKTFDGKPFLCTTRKVRHCVRLHKMMVDAGLKVGLVHGGFKGHEQEQVFNLLATGKIDGIVAIYSCVSEGLNIPNLEHLIKLDGIGSEQVLEQQKGRPQRAFEGKEVGYLHIPIDLQADALARKSRSFIAYYKQRGIPVEKVISD